MPNIKRTKDTNEIAARLRTCFQAWAAKDPEVRTQRRLADAVGVTQAAVSFFLSGARPITYDVAAKLAVNLECKIDDFSPRMAARVREMCATACRPERSSTRRSSSATAST